MESALREMLAHAVQVVPVIWTVPQNGTANGRQLATPTAWPVPNLQRLPDYFTGPGLAVDLVGQNSAINPDNPTTLIGGRRRLQEPRAQLLDARGSNARRKLQQVSVGGSAPPLPPGLQGAVFRPRPGFPSAHPDNPTIITFLSADLVVDRRCRGESARHGSASHRPNGVESTAAVILLIC